MRRRLTLFLFLLGISLYIGIPVQWNNPGSFSVAVNGGIFTGVMAAGDMSENGYHQLYQDGLNAYRAGEYYKAIQTFSVLQRRRAVPPLADNVQYWLAESFYALERYPRAVMEFREVLVFPENNKAEDALYKLAFCYIRLDQPQKALAYLETLKYRYPGSRLQGRADSLMSRMTLPEGLASDKSAHPGDQDAVPREGGENSGTIYTGYYERAMDYYRAGRYDRAIPMLERVVQWADDPDLQTLAQYWLMQYKHHDSPRYPK